MNKLISKISNLFRKYGIKSVTMGDITKELSIVGLKKLKKIFGNKKIVIYLHPNKKPN